MLRSIIRPIAALLLLLSAALVARAQEGDSPLAPLDTSSPRATYESVLRQGERLRDGLLAYWRAPSDDGYDALAREVARAGRLFDLSQVPVAQREDVAAASAARLRDILVRLPRVPLDAVPADGPETPRWRIPGSEIEIVRVGEGPGAEHLLSAETVERLPEFHAMIIGEPRLWGGPISNWHALSINLTGPAISRAMVSAMPDALREPVLGTPLWKALATALLWALGALVTLLAIRAGARLSRDAGPVRRHAAGLIAPVALLTVVAWGGAVADRQINIAGAFGLLNVSVAAVVLAIAAAWAIWIAIGLLVEALIASPLVRDGGYDAHLMRLLGRVGSAAGATAALVWGANAIGIPVLGVVAGVSVTGLAVALAAQSTLENLFGGLSVFADRPFRIGEFIRYGENLGTIESIGPRSARIRGLDGTVTAIPNSDLARMHVVNYSRRSHSQIVQTIGLRYDTSPETLVRALAAIRGAAATHEWVLETETMPRARVMRFADSAIEIELRADVATRDYGRFLEVQEDVLIEVIRAVDAAGAAFAFPTRTLVLEQAGEQRDDVGA